MPVAADSITAVAPLNWITMLGLALIILVGLITLVVRFLPMSTVVREVGTWDCGYSLPTARIQYTGSSLGQMLVRLFGFPVAQNRRAKTAWRFFRATQFKSLVPDTVLDRLVVPVFNLAGRYLPWLRIMQQGQTHLYVLYIVVIVMILMIWGACGN